MLSLVPLVGRAAARRMFHRSAIRLHENYDPSKVDPTTAVEFEFVDRDGSRKTVLAPPGKSVLDVAHANDIDLEGACEGSLACSTCHVYVDEDTYRKLPEPTDDENDMLDLAFGLKENSRLGCQVLSDRSIATKIEITLPPATRNMAVDGFKPKPH
eukprot:Plantae.Rhodophyta-Purpureofilum_apyrenoidigerum.ctg19589.p1 GENE.Plantae.Rhodophyta-Purpureofilum_apyrenoidigerum.ctg19589~~Plantae.Rhodophyta-Purpureofilum_apyrenoidigerum.ctg19589.p1  ORF type:complete len:156 (+),score=27.36 Plantae.Rhodophyta-Purpureofilum_apyrenoidigerum.ctg19589:66-533(+)